MNDEKFITSIKNGRTLGSATPQKKDTPKEPTRVPIDEGKGLGRATPAKR